MGDWQGAEFPLPLQVPKPGSLSGPASSDVTAPAAGPHGAGDAQQQAADRPASSPSLGAAGGSGGPRQAAPRLPLACRVPGCTLRLTLPYSQRHRICRQHQRAGVIDVEGQPWRYCQQCARLQQVEAFDGDKRSCRESLLQQKARRVQKEQRRGQPAEAHADAAAAAAGASPAAGDACPPKRQRATPQAWALAARSGGLAGARKQPQQPQRGREGGGHVLGPRSAEDLCQQQQQPQRPQPRQQQQQQQALAVEASCAAPALALQHPPIAADGLGSLSGRLSQLEGQVRTLRQLLLGTPSLQVGAASPPPCPPSWDAPPPACHAPGGAAAAATALDAALAGDPLASLVLQLAAAAAAQHQQQQQDLLSLLTGLSGSDGSSSSSGGASAVTSPGVREQLQRQLAEAVATATQQQLEAAEWAGCGASGGGPATNLLPAGAKLCSEPRQSLALPAAAATATAAAAAAAGGGDGATGQARAGAAAPPHPNPFLSARSAGAAGLGRALQLAAALAAPASAPLGAGAGFSPCAAEVRACP